MDTTLEERVASMEQSNRRYRIALVAAGLALAGSVMLGLQKEDENAERPAEINGFSAIVDRGGAISYFRLVDRDEVQILDTSRGDKWFWRRIRNWPGY
jgi:hypothetical protein